MTTATLEKPIDNRTIALKPFQARSVGKLAEIIQNTAQKIVIGGQDHRRQISMAQGVALLRAPTGSGKTLMIGRTLESTVGVMPRKTAWLWFAPFSGLVTQTRDAIKAQCPALRQRDIRTDRDPALARDGDLFITTWGSVSAQKKESRQIRREGETAPSLDIMIDALRADGWLIGVVIDEAHVNFGMSAKVAADLYLRILKPDFTILATATPKDGDLEDFQKAAGIKDINRIEVDRAEVVAAGLNKVGVKAIHFRASEKDAKLLDIEEVAIAAALAQHNRIKQELSDRGVPMNPLLLIQVDDQAAGADDPVEKVRRYLKDHGHDMARVAVHTSGEPDPYFHTLAYDEDKDILIFKVAVATGFDAPRAWALVSLRGSRGVEFGHQIIGRIMRVESRLQHLHGALGMLDWGYVFLANPDQQMGLVQAAREIQEIKSEIATVTDHVTVYEVVAGGSVVVDPRTGFSAALHTEAGRIDADGQVARSLRIGGGMEMDRTERTRAFALQAVGLFADFASDPARAPAMAYSSARSTMTATAPPKDSGWIAYHLRDDIEFPKALAREVLPKSMDGLVDCIATRIQFDDSVINLTMRTAGKVLVTEEDLFGGGRTTEERSYELSNARIAQQAQQSFRFNDSIDERLLKPALLKRLTKEIDRRGLSVPPEKDLRRAVDLVAMVHPYLLHDACRACLATVVEIRQDEPIPQILYGPKSLETSQKNLYRVFPHNMNVEELAFARLLDQDDTGTVLWWLRNPESVTWAVSVIMPNGRRYYPDFVVCVDGRQTRNPVGLALVEVKDDGETGRLFSKGNTEKVRSLHRIYGSVLMVYRDAKDGSWMRVEYNAAARIHQPAGDVRIEELRHV